MVTIERMGCLAFGCRAVLSVLLVESVRNEILINDDGGDSNGGNDCYRFVAFWCGERFQRFTLNSVKIIGPMCEILFVKLCATPLVR